jgi:predicted DNA-binding ArsR family transcriptional regulator
MSESENGYNSFWSRLKDLIVTLWRVLKDGLKTSSLLIYVKSVSEENIKESIDRFKGYLNDTNGAIKSVSKSIESLQTLQPTVITEFTIKLLSNYRAKLVELQYHLANRLQKAFQTLLTEINSLNVESRGEPIPVSI